MSQKDDQSLATQTDLILMHSSLSKDMLAMRSDIQDMMKIFMGAIGDLENRLGGRIDGVETRMDSIEDKMATKDDLENLKHQLLLSDEQTRQDIADMYSDQLSTHDDRITKLEIVTGLKA